MDLCLPDCTWVEEKEIDLYPYDAGTDNGITYMVSITNKSNLEKFSGEYKEKYLNFITTREK